MKTDSKSSGRIRWLLIGICIGCVTGKIYSAKRCAETQCAQQKNKKTKIIRELPHPSQLGRTDTGYKWYAPKGSTSLDKRLLLVTKFEPNPLDYQTIKELLVLGANPNIIDPSNPELPTPLHNVVEIPELVALLLEYGAALTPNEAGETALHTLFLKSPPEFWKQEMNSAQLLLDLGDNINSVTKEGETTLHLACLTNCSAAKIKFLLENNADVTKRNDRGETALHCASYSGNNPLIKILFDNGADLTARDSTNRTPLMVAKTIFKRHKSENHRSALRLLKYLERGPLKEVIFHKTAA